MAKHVFFKHFLKVSKMLLRKVFSQFFIAKYFKKLLLFNITINTINFSCLESVPHNVLLTLGFPSNCYSPFANSAFFNLLRS